MELLWSRSRASATATSRRSARAVTRSFRGSSKVLSRTRRTTALRPGSRRRTRRWPTTSGAAASRRCEPSDRTTPCSPSSRPRGSSATAVPASRRFASGRQSSSTPGLACSSSTPTRASRERSRIATSWSCARTCSSRGMAIAARFAEAEHAIVYLREEYATARARLLSAIAEFRSAGLLGAMPVEIVTGAGSYVCGEETAMLESLEGRRGMPRLRPPFPAESGYLGRPTLINNVETLAHIPAILRHGGAWFAGHGENGATGLRLWSISGTVARPGCYEAPNGIVLRDAARRVRGRGHGGDRRDRARRRCVRRPPARSTRRAAHPRGHGRVGLQPSARPASRCSRSVPDRPPAAGDDAVLRRGVLPEVHAVPHRHARPRVRAPRAGGGSQRCWPASSSRNGCTRWSEGRSAVSARRRRRPCGLQCATGRRYSRRCARPRRRSTRARRPAPRARWDRSPAPPRPRRPRRSCRESASAKCSRKCAGVKWESAPSRTRIRVTWPPPSA